MLHKRGRFYSYKFKWSVLLPDGSREHFQIRRSTRSPNKKDALLMQEDHRRALAMGLIHPRDPWPRPATPTAPTFRNFTTRFLEHCESHNRPKTVRFYRQAIQRVLQTPILENMRMTDVTPETVSKYVVFRRARFSGNSISTLNSDITTLRRIFKLAAEWSVIPRALVLHKLPGANGRDRVVTPEEECEYLQAADSTSPLRDVAIIAVDTGLRPNSELFPLQWSDVSLESSAEAPFGVLHVRHGKTSKAARVVPLTPRARQVLLRRKTMPTSRFVFPGSGVEGHLMSVKHAHDGAIKRAAIKPFPFYCWRHTYGTRCAESGMDRFTLARLMGHSSPSVAERYYIHVTTAHVGKSVDKFFEYHSQLQLGSEMVQ